MSTQHNSQEAFHSAAQAALAAIEDHLFNMRSHGPWRPMPQTDRQRLLDMQLPVDGTNLVALVGLVHEQIFPYPLGNGHPRFMAWVNSPPSLPGLIGGLLANAMNPSCAGGDQAAVYLEYTATRWLCELLELHGDTRASILVDGGSVANLTCLAAARQWVFEQYGHDLRAKGNGALGERLRAYTSDQTHSCVQKAFEVMGLGHQALRRVVSHPDGVLDVSALHSAIASDRAAGWLPFAIIGNLGTVNSGAIDPIETLADICRDERLWLHLDGSYGAFGVLHGPLQHLFAGVNRANSLAVDPHKWLSVPVECGCAIVADADLLRRTFELIPDYVEPPRVQVSTGKTAFASLGISMSREFRALKLWMTFAALGRNAIAATITRHIELAQRLAGAIGGLDAFRIMSPPVLSVVCFQFVPPEFANDHQALDKLNARLAHAIQAEGHFFLAGTIFQGRRVLRACVLHRDTDDQDIDALVTYLPCVAAAVTDAYRQAPND